jgi:hypothetical protein
MESGYYPKGISHENSFSIQSNAGKLGPETVKGSENKQTHGLSSQLGMFSMRLGIAKSQAVAVFFTKSPRAWLYALSARPCQLGYP